MVVVVGAVVVVVVVVVVGMFAGVGVDTVFLFFGVLAKGGGTQVGHTPQKHTSGGVTVVLY
jgi:hypothetical protein